MKLVGKTIERNGAGTVGLIPEEQEDMWHAFNLIQVGDSLQCKTVRKVTSESSTGSTSSQRIPITLAITVETIDYDHLAGTLHVKGRNIMENPHVKLGAYHTLDLECNRKFTLKKDCWDAIHLDRINQACDVAKHADVAAVVMQEGLAHVCLITSSMTIVRAKIDMTIPRKRKSLGGQHEKALLRFYDAVLQAVLRHVNFEVVKCVLVASPGFVREQFMEYLLQQASKEGNKSLLENKSRFLLVHSSSGFKHSLKEVLADPSVSSRLSDTKAQAEVKLLEVFNELLATDPARAYYGLKHVTRANEAQAIETMMISDDLFRCADFRQRKKYVALVESVKEQGGAVKIFSSMHVSGEQLSQLTGVAAILRFPMPEIEDEDDEEDDEYDDEMLEIRPSSSFNIRGATTLSLSTGSAGR